MPGVRIEYQQELRTLEASALGGLDLVSSALTRTLEAVEHQDIELAQIVVADDDRIDGRYLEVHQGILSLLALQAPVAGDLRLQNENGAVEIRVSKLGSMQVENRQGDVQIYLPEKAAFQVDAHANNGEIQSDYSELKVENTDDDRASASGKVGNGGPQLTLSNEHGTIEIRRGGSMADAAPHIPPPPPPPPKLHNPPESPKESDN